MEFDFGIESGVYNFEDYVQDLEKENTGTPTEENKGEEPEKDEITDEEEPQEGVGNEEEETPEPDEEGSSQLYPSIANALSGDGVFSYLTEEDLKNVKDAKSLREAFKKELEAGLDEQQKRISEALNYGVELDKISTYEKTLQYLKGISEDDIKNEESGEELRKRLIYQSYINKGKSPERATREVERSFKNGDDIEDALEAYNDNLEYYQDAYDDTIEEAKKKKEKEEEKLKERAESIQKIFEDESFFKELGISKDIGKQALSDVSVAKYRDPKTGEMLTAVQKAQRDNEAKFLRGLGIAFTLTNGFKEFDKLFKGVVNKQVKSKLSEIEKSLTLSPSGEISYVGKPKNKTKKIEF